MNVNRLVRIEFQEINDPAHMDCVNQLKRFPRNKYGVGTLKNSSWVSHVVFSLVAYMSLYKTRFIPMLPLQTLSYFPHTHTFPCLFFVTSVLSFFNELRPFSSFLCFFCSTPTCTVLYYPLLMFLPTREFSVTRTFVIVYSIFLPHPLLANRRTYTCDTNVFINNFITINS
jgi:hypothetical protein